MDVGLRNAKLNFRQQEVTHIMENVIYNELRMRGFAVDVGVVEAREMRNGKSLPIPALRHLTESRHTVHRWHYAAGAVTIVHQSRRLFQPI